MNKYIIVIPDDVENEFLAGALFVYDTVTGIIITQEMFKMNGTILKEDELSKVFCNFREYANYAWPKHYFVIIHDIKDVNIVIGGLTLEEIEKCNKYKSKNLCNKYCEMLQEGKCEKEV